MLFVLNFENIVKVLAIFLLQVTCKEQQWHQREFMGKKRLTAWTPPERNDRSESYGMLFQA